jgi:hypothetical protein
MSEGERLAKKIQKKTRVRKQRKRRVSNKQGTLSQQVMRSKTQKKRKKRSSKTIKVKLKKNA